MLVEKTIKELYKESAYIDELYWLLWESLKDERNSYDDKKEFLAALKKKEKDQIVHSVIFGYQKYHLFEESNIEENILLDFLLDTSKKVFIDFLDNEILEHIHSRQEILVIVLDAVNELKPDKDKLLEVNGSYTDMLFCLEVMATIYHFGFLGEVDVTPKELVKWFNDMPSGGIEWLRIKSWRVMKATERLSNN